MSNSTNQYQPDTASIIGGYPSSFDFVPSILLSAAYSISLLLWVSRQFRPETRILLPVLHSITFSIEHIIIFGVRAGQTHTTLATMNVFFLYWCQMTFAIGYLNFALTAVVLLRDLTTNATLADEGRGSEDQPELRKNFRRMGGLFSLAYLSALFIGIVASGAHGVGVKSSYVISMRYLSGSIGFTTLVVFIWRLQSMKQKLPFIDEAAVRRLTFICLIVLIVPVYRLTVMYNRTPNLPGTDTPDISASGSLTSKPAKVAFYIFHMIPEVVVSFTLHLTDIRKTFNVSQWGDTAWSDNKGIPRLRENGQIVEGVGIDLSKPRGQKESGRFGPFKFRDGNPSQQDDDDGAYASLLAPAPAGLHDGPQQYGQITVEPVRYGNGGIA